MTGIVYQLTDNKIISIIPDVLEVTENSIKGANREQMGIDTTKAGIRVIDPYAVIDTPEGIKISLTSEGSEIGEGDQVDPATLVDTRVQLPKTKDQEIADLKTQLVETQNAINFLLGL